MAKAISRSLPAGPAVASLARHLVDEIDGSLSEERLADARLIASELATNAARYGTSGAPVHLELRWTGRAMRLEVSSAGPFRLPCSPTAPRGGTGLGLVLVTSLADRWGLESDSHTVVWAEVGDGGRGTSSAA